MGTKAGGDPAIEVRDGVERVRTDPDRPPVAVRAPHLITGREKIVFALIALLGAVGWSMIAVVRGEHVNAVWFVFAAVCTYIIGFRFYARVLFGHHFAAIAGAGPLVGPVLAAQMPPPGPSSPFLFITIACGALSGFHALISSGTTPKLIEKESQARFMATTRCSPSPSSPSWRWSRP